MFTIIHISPHVCEGTHTYAKESKHVQLDIYEQKIVHIVFLTGNENLTITSATLFFKCQFQDLGKLFCQGILTPIFGDRCIHYEHII